MVKNRRKPSGHTEIKRGGNVGSDTCSDVLGKYIIDVRDRSGPCLAGRFGFGNLDAKLVSPASQLVVSPAQTRFCRRLRWRLVLELHDLRRAQQVRRAAGTHFKRLAYERANAVKASGGPTRWNARKNGNIRNECISPVSACSTAACLRLQHGCSLTSLTASPTATPGNRTTDTQAGLRGPRTTAFPTTSQL